MPDPQDPLPSYLRLATLFSIYDRCSRLPSTTRKACEELAAQLPCHMIPPEGKGETYIRRYGVADLVDGSHVYLQNILRSDEDPELHSHPAPARALILVEGYSEERRLRVAGTSTGYEVVRAVYRAGDVNILDPDTFHRLDLIEDSAWTIFIMGPKAIRTAGEASWSFWNRNTGATTGYRDFIAAKGYEAVSTPQGLATGSRVSPAPSA